MKSLILLFLLIALQCTACNNKDMNKNGAGPVKNEAFNTPPPVSSPGEGYSSPQSFAKKGRFCIVVYGMKDNTGI
jgi:hypothetical protein